MLLQPTLGGLCRVTRRLVLLQFPPSLFIFIPLLRSRQQRVLQNVLVRVCVESALIEGQRSLSPRTESCPRIHRQLPTFHLVTRNFTHRFGPDKVVSWVSSFELFERMFVSKYHVTPVPLDIGLGELQSAALVSLRQSRGFLLFKNVQTSTMRCSLYGLVAHIADLLSLQLPRDYSTRAASFFAHFSFHTLLHTLRKLPWPPSTLGIVK